MLGGFEAECCLSDEDWRAHQSYEDTHVGLQETVISCAFKYDPPHRRKCAQVHEMAVEGVQNGWVPGCYCTYSSRGRGSIFCTVEAGCIHAHSQFAEARVLATGEVTGNRPAANAAAYGRISFPAVLQWTRSCLKLAPARLPVYNI